MALSTFCTHFDVETLRCYFEIGLLHVYRMFNLSFSFIVQTFDSSYFLLLQEYHLPNQPVHTVDVAITPYLRPHPPVSRTQSSPSLYSSNLIGSPLGSRRKNSPSSKIPRPPTSGVNADESLPPRPPVHGIRRPLGHRPVFSSGTSWRKRKWWSITVYLDFVLSLQTDTLCYWEAPYPLKHFS